MVKPRPPVSLLQDKINSKRLQGLLVTDIYNVRYLTGFTGSSGFCIITPKNRLFFTDFRYAEQAEQEVKGWALEVETGKRIDAIKAALSSLSLKRLGFEASLPYSLYAQLAHLNISLSPCDNLIETLRMSKGAEELRDIRRAYRKAERAFIYLKSFIRSGVKESELALRLETALKGEGCSRIPFDIIVASGANSSRPHASVTDKKIERGDFVIIDWGGEHKGYYSDITRTLLIKGGDLSRKREIYQIVNEARQQAITAASAGVKAKTVDNAAREHIKNKGYGEYFGHGTGHGIGLQTHEGPRINRLSAHVLTEGMVFTIEPGIYIKSFGGVRIEDTVAITANRAEVLNRLSTRLEIIDR